jgi:hypothetical protein
MTIDWNFPLGFGIRVGVHSRRRKVPDVNWLRVQVAHLGETESEIVVGPSPATYFVRGRFWGHMVVISRPRWWLDMSIVRWKK